MRTKFIKVSTADRLPEKTEWFYTEEGLMYWVYDKQSWEDVDGNDDTVGIDFYLEEKPDYEEEMKEVLNKVVGFTSLGEKVPDHLTHEIEELLTKLKTES